MKTRILETIVMIKDYLKVTYERIKSDTPRYFRRMIAAGLFIGSVGGGLIVAGDTIPESVQTAAKYMVAIGITTSIVAKSTTTSETLTIKSDEILIKDKSESTSSL